jgi:DNA polymerase-3 subunit beta
VHIESPDSGKLRMVATDGHRLALIEREVSGMRLTRGAILPRKGVAEIERLLKLKEQDGEVELIVEPRLAWIKAGNTQVSMRLVEGEFPDYQAVIPKSSRYEVVVSRDLLEAAIKRAAIFSNERFHGVKLELSGQTLTVSSITPGLGEAKDVIDVEFSGNDFTVGFNASYLLQVLAALPQGCSITIGLTDEVSPGVITTPTDSSYTYVVMPMRL